MVEIEELKSQFLVRNLEPYGDCIIVPHNAFQHPWEKDLEAQGYRVFSNEFEGRQHFFIRLLKGKPKEVSVLQTQTMPLNKANLLKPSLQLEREGRFARVPLSLLESSPEAPREIYEDIEILAATIRQHGLLEPLIVTPRKDRNSYQVIAGERRLRACRKAGLETVPCIVLEGLSAEQCKELQLIENVQRKDLKPYEEMKIVRALRDRGLDVKEIAVACGISCGTVQNYLLMSETLPVQVQKTIERDSHNPQALTVYKALILANAKLEPAEIEAKVALVRKEGASIKDLARKVAEDAPTKLRRVRESRTFWRELTRSLREYAKYWKDHAKLEEWEDVSNYHLKLEVKLPKDMKELKAPSLVTT